MRQSDASQGIGVDRVDKEVQLDKYISDLRVLDSKAKVLR